MENVEEKVVKRGLCSGCGLCAGVSNNCIKMLFNKNGEWNPSISGCRECGLCASVCPTINKLDTDVFATYYGEYIGCYAGFSKMGNERKNASSGGMITRMLKVLLEKKEVSKVVVVGRSLDPEKLFEPIFVDKSEELDNLSSSKYYPVEFSSIIKYLKNNEDTVAIVGLPCVIRGLRLIQKKYPAIGNKIKYLFGLTCSHNNNKNYSEFLLRESGVKVDALKEINYRGKEGIQCAINFYFQATNKNGTLSKKLVNKGFLADLWRKGFFCLPACLKCSDLVSEQADISFMDAWVEPFMSDPRGTSFVVVRNEKMKELLEQEFSQGHIFLQPIKERLIMRAQLGGFILKKVNSTNKHIMRFNSRISNFYRSFGSNTMLFFIMLRVIVFVENVFSFIYVLLSKIKSKVKTATSKVRSIVHV